MYQSYNGRDDYFWNSQKLVHRSTRAGQPARNFTGISAGLTDLHKVEDTSIRITNEQLLNEAQAEQDAKLAITGLMNLHSLDLSVSWAP